ncbi:hypothetical protein PAJ_1558 [Pantoea ananatis AJ13355]|uniref:Uncharacterized protein n=1 Tax=Pantoea ananatis (strain AJ13355) TaxID=932677 RepID=A0A0H3KX37_PANAA|nr:hypothetical protein PAJ_1558 [Pantoea ananatis AJ13355]
MRMLKAGALSKQLLSQRTGLVILFINATFLQFRHQQIDDISKGFMREGIGQIKAIHVRLLHPALQFIGNGFCAAHQQGAKAANAHPVGHVLHRPFTLRIGCGEALYNRLNGIGMQMLKNLVGLVLTEIDAGPAGDQRQCAFMADIAFVILPLGLGRFIGFPHNDRLHIENQNTARIATGLLCTTTYISHGFLQQHFRRRGNKYALGVLCGEGFTAAGCACLIQHRRALGRRLTQMNARYLEKRSLMINGVHLIGIAENMTLAIAYHGIILPTAFQQLVYHLQIFVGVVITRIVAGLADLSQIAGSAFQIGGNDIPADPTFGQMIQRRHAPGKRIGMLKRE